METVRVLFFGDVVGPRGLEALRRALPTLRTELNPDFVIANGENLDIIDPARGLSGMHPESLASLLELGVNAVTGGTTPSIPLGPGSSWNTPGCSGPST